MLRVSNVKKLIQGLSDFYDHISGPASSWVNSLDPLLIAKEGDVEQLVKLIQLILGAAVNCQRKDFYIENIMKLDTQTQMEVKSAIECLFPQFNCTHDEVAITRSNLFTQSIDSTDVITSTTESLGTSIENVTNTTQRQDLLKDIRQLIHHLATSIEFEETSFNELLDLKTQLRKLFDKRHISSFQLSATSNFNLQNGTSFILSTSLIESGEADAAAVIKLRSEMETLRENLFKMKNVKEQLRVKCELLEEELIDLKVKNEKLHQRNNLIKHLEDELDIHKEICKKIHSYEATIETYRGKMDQLYEFKRKIKSVSEENDSIQTKLDEEVQVNSILKSNNQQLKEQILQLNLDLTTANHKIQSSEFEVKLLEEKLDKLNCERQELSKELVEVKSQLESSQNESQIICQINNQIANSLSAELKNDQLESKIQSLQSEKAHLKDQLEYLIDKMASVLPELNIDPADGSVRVEQASFNSSISRRRDSRNSEMSTTDSENAYKLIDSLRKEINFWKKKVLHFHKVLQKREKQMNQIQIHFQEQSMKARQIAKVLEPITLKPRAFHLINETT